MNKWTSYSDIKNVLIQKWDRGHILRSVFLEDEFFPLIIPLKYPTGKDFAFLPEIILWHENIKSYENLELKYKTFSSKIHGKNTLPTHAIIKDANTAVKMIKKEKDYKNFINNSKILIGEFPSLKDWIAKKVIKVSKIDDVKSIVKVLKWFTDGNETNVYLRQICIEGIHTKFIERNKSIISEMLDVVLPSEKVNFEFSKFEERYNIKTAPNTIRFRILDDNFAINGLTDLTVMISEFERLSIDVENVFFTENLANFLSFPNKKSSCAVFGGGYAISDFKSAKWLNEKNLYYWGDIDTHGFNILSMARGGFKNIKSILMNEEILLAHKEMWVREEKQFVGEIHNLTSEELKIYTKLKNNFYGENIRLEQELIKFSFIEEVKL